MTQQPCLKMLKDLVATLDLTSLNPNDNDATILKLSRDAISPFGNVAAICVYPQFISLLATQLTTKEIKIATVANFPTGQEEFSHVFSTIETALQHGAEEIDVVFPYTLYFQGKTRKALNFITACKQICGQHRLKVIIEISEFSDESELYHLALDIIAAGADFLKTSTGKSKQGASLEKAQVLLSAIKTSCQPIGIKISGGIKTIDQAFAYLQLTKSILASDAIDKSRFRIGASSLLQDIVASIQSVSH